jgi:hypothetical protein
MAPKNQESSRRTLNGEKFPARQLRISTRFAIGGALVGLFIIPDSIGAFRLNDSSSVAARPGLIFVDIAVLAWTAGWILSVRKFGRLVRSTYDRPLLAPRSSRRSRLMNRVRWVFVWLSAASWASMQLTGVMTASTHSNQISVPAWGAAAFFLTGCVALVLSAILEDRKTGISPPEAFDLERAQDLREEVRRLGSGLEEITTSIAQSLSEKISNQIADLERVSGEVIDAQHKREIIQGTVNSEMKSLSREIYDISTRGEHRRQWAFALLSFLFGFVINWLTNPVWNLFRGLRFLCL